MMSIAKALVIVESQTKAKTINKYLGDNYVVKSSVGHIRDLPNCSSISKKNIDPLSRKKFNKHKKDKYNALANRMGINPWRNWEAHYEIVPGKENIVAELKKLAEKVEHIYLATDLDREGEAIAWHLKEVIGGDNKRYSRVIFNEITKNAIFQAFEKPCELNIDRVNAQQARRFMDRVVGYMVSPLLWKKIARGLSAGRVQSVAVRLVVEREREIKEFTPKEYWKIFANVASSNNVFLSLEVTHRNKKIFQPKNQDQTIAAVSLLKKAHYQIIKREDKPITSRPNAPFTTSTLQQASSSKLGFSLKKTMNIAQRLYEAGYITYIRTDSTHLSYDAVNMVRSYINDNFGEEYLSKSINQYTNIHNSQEAHEAIRPSNVSILAESLKNMEIDTQKLYQLIWQRFVACQMTAAEYNSITFTVVADNFLLKTNSRIIHFDGWRKVIPTQWNNDNTIQTINTADELSLIKLIPEQHFTKPPLRFNEASLVKEMEKRGIGRPSTYASIISTIQDRGYVRIENRRFYAEKIGEIVTYRLEENFCELMSYDFTAHMENSLDQVANHEVEWKKVLDKFFKNFIHQLIKAEKDPKEGGMQPNHMVLTSIICPSCNRKMGIRTATTGVFLGCFGYIQLKERCKTTINLVPENEVFNSLPDSETETNALRIKRRCKNCNTAMDSYFIDTMRKLYICGNNPTCEGYEIENGDFHKEYEAIISRCEKCSFAMCFKIGRFGKYIACTNEQCKNTRKILRNGKIAPPKEKPVPLPELLCENSDAYFVLRNGSSGIFLAANTFPKSRETRAPQVKELYQFRDRLPNKLHYLADAPQQDPEGNMTIVRFRHKTKQQYISTEKNGKETGWLAFFINGKWIESNK